MKKEYLILALAALVIYRIIKNRNREQSTNLIEEVDELEITVTPAMDSNLSAKTEKAKNAAGVYQAESFDKLHRSPKELIKPPFKLARA